ncbi:MAG: HD domain-containing protein, partial [Methanobacteriaceae archaeon]|nr:HD domain-containing protein [Methanobacteriaceae archaeon]
HGFVDLCGQLRFQKRWAHSPRIPETSVLGHMLIVAATAYLCSLEIGIRICDNRFYNNFFAGLFHDLPEVLTKDIISPVKQSVEGLDDIIKEYEDYRMNEDLFPLLPESWHDEIVYFTKNEFLNKIKINEKENEVSFKDLNNKYNLDNFSPIDGELLETCDKLAAFVEANLSIRYGIKSETLEEAQIKIYNEYGSRKFGKLNFKEIFDFFKV